MSLEVEENTDLTKPEDEAPKLSPVNIANGVLFFGGVIFVCICQTQTWIGGKTLDQALTEKATILSPAHGTWDKLFLVWIAIFAFEAIFVLAQLGPMRDHHVVRKIRFSFSIQCLVQIAYFVAVMNLDDGLLWIPGWLSIANFAILMWIIALIESDGKRTFIEYWTLRAPFSLHAGYLLCDAIVWLSIFLQERNDNAAGVVIATSMTGVTAVLTLTTVCAMALPRPDGLFCFGVAYTYYFVARELYCAPDAEACYARTRVNLPVEDVSDATLKAFHYAATSICFIAGCLGVLAWGLRVAACCQRGRVYD